MVSETDVEGETVDGVFVVCRTDVELGSVGIIVV